MKVSRRLLLRNVDLWKQVRDEIFYSPEGRQRLKTRPLICDFCHLPIHRQLEMPLQYPNRWQKMLTARSPKRVQQISMKFFTHRANYKAYHSKCSCEALWHTMKAFNKCEVCGKPVRRFLRPFPLVNRSWVKRAERIERKNMRYTLCSRTGRITAIYHKQCDARRGETQRS